MDSINATAAQVSSPATADPADPDGPEDSEALAAVEVTVRASVENERKEMSLLLEKCLEVPKRMPMHANAPSRRTHIHTPVHNALFLRYTITSTNSWLTIASATPAAVDAVLASSYRKRAVC